MKNYLETLITEKGTDIESDVIGIDKYNMNFTYEVLIECICGMSSDDQKKVRDNLVMIDFKNGNIFHFLTYLGKFFAPDKD